MKYLLFIILLIIVLPVRGETYYVSTTGDNGNNGTSIETSWLTWQYAINAAYPGDTIFVCGGVYYVTELVEVNPNRWPDGAGRTGTEENQIYFWAYPPDYASGNLPILDCNNVISLPETNYSCFGLNAVQYWYIKGITIRNGWQKGVSNRRAQGFGASNSANITYENCTAHDITGRGFYFESGAWNTWDAEFADPDNPVYALWDSDTTRWINCDTYNVCDSANNSSGDGWKAGNYYRGVFIWEGCRAWNYADDGFDPSGAGKRIFRNCWAMSTDKYEGLGLDVEANGFKTSAVGDDQEGYRPADYVFVEVYNCIAAYNIGYGFYNNLELGNDNNAKYINNTSYKNLGGFFDMPLVVVDSRGLEMRNNIAYDNSSELYEQAGVYNPSVYTESNNTWVANQTTNGWPGWEYNTNFTVTDDDFVSLDQTQLIAPRKVDGSLPDITFLTLAEGSDLIDGGINVGLTYYGDAPDLGYAEFVEGAPVDPPATSGTIIKSGNSLIIHNGTIVK